MPVMALRAILHSWLQEVADDVHCAVPDYSITIDEISASSKLTAVDLKQFAENYGT